jgi:hypothetical protein
MKIEHHDSFRMMIDESLAGALPVETEQSLREHVAGCAACGKYLRASNRVIAGLGGFSFEVDPNHNARVVAALAMQAQQRHDSGTARQHGERVNVWAALAVALSMAMLGSAVVYQMAKLLMAPLHFDTGQVQAGVVVFWLLPSFCAALGLLAARSEKRGIA